MTRALALAALTTLGALGVGCAFDDAALLRGCATAADCGQGQVCSNFRCTAAEQASGRVALELRPPPGSPYARTQHLDLDLEDGAALSVALPVPTELEALVLDSQGAPVAADLLIFGARRIPGRELEVSQFVTAQDRRTILRLPEGEYLARILPLDPELPGLEVRGFTVRARNELVTKEFRLPARYRRLYGHVMSSVSSDRKVPGVEVRAIAEWSGLASTTAITDAEGRYEIRLPETTDTFFRLIATPPAELQPAWSFERVVRVDLGQDRDHAIELEPAGDAVRGLARVRVLGLSAEGSPHPLRNATVTLTSSVSRLYEPPIHRLAGTTDADGVLVVEWDGAPRTEVTLLKTIYSVEVSPPPSAPFAKRRTTLDFTGASLSFVVDAQVVLSPRTRVQGSLSSEIGRPVPGARIELEPLGGHVRPSEAETDAAGRFSVELDPGRYLMVARPQEHGSQAERFPVGTRVVEIAEGPDPELPVLTLPRGSLLEGRVIAGDDGRGVTRTEVELFLELAQRALPVARGVSDAEGRFTLTLPARE